MSQTKPAVTFVRSFALHLSCTAWILFVGLVSLARHRSLGELQADASSGSARQRIESLFALSQREPLSAFRARSPRSLLDEPDALLREFAFSNSFTRNRSQRLDDQAIQSLLDPYERSRASLWLHCRMTTPRRVTLADLDDWFSQPAP